MKQKEQPENKKEGLGVTNAIAEIKKFSRMFGR